MCRMSWNLGASTSWKPQGLSRPEEIMLYLTASNKIRSYSHRLTTHHMIPESSWIVLLGVNMFHPKNKSFIFPFLVLSRLPNYCRYSKLLLHLNTLSGTRARTHIHTHTHTQSIVLSGRGNGPSHRSLPAQHTTFVRDSHAPSEIRTRNSSKRAAADLRLGPRGQQDRLPTEYQEHKISAV